MTCLRVKESFSGKVWTLKQTRYRRNNLTKEPLRAVACHHSLSGQVVPLCRLCFCICGRLPRTTVKAPSAAVELIPKAVAPNQLLLQLPNQLLLQLPNQLLLQLPNQLSQQVQLRYQKAELSRHSQREDLLSPRKAWNTGELPNISFLFY